MHTNRFAGSSQDSSAAQAAQQPAPPAPAPRQFYAKKIEDPGKHCGTQAKDDAGKKLEDPVIRRYLRRSDTTRSPVNSFVILRSESDSMQVVCSVCGFAAASYGFPC